ncbi:MAG: esterase/lipase family protein [Acetatifactor sp.]
MKQTRVDLCRAGNLILRIFSITTFLGVALILAGLCGVFGEGTGFFDNAKIWILVCIVTFLVELTVFWVGIILVYVSSTQLGIKWRVWGAVCGWIPIVHLFMLGKIIRVTSAEVKTEQAKNDLNAARASEKICATRYPILLVHGVFFRDFEHLNYWGRIPGELEKNGATCYYGNHNSAAAVKDSAIELRERIQEIVEKTGCEKVNIIAHSKGGLDSRCAISLEGMAPYVASLTTINTPHRGCEFADYLLSKIPQTQQQMVARTYNAAAAKLGDINPDFLAAVYDLTHTKCMERNEQVKDSPLVYYQSFGSKLTKAVSGRFPLNFTHPLVKYFDGANDGLVGETSFPWGDHYQFLTNTKKRGISHADMIDLNRENIPGFDVREFYVQLVADLKKKGF